MYHKIFLFLWLLFIPFAGEGKFIVITPEKCGTFLLTKALVLMTAKGYIHYFPRKVVDLGEFLDFIEAAEKKNQFVYCHVSPDREVIESLKKLRYKVFFILRDPRDQLVSGMYMIRDGHPLAEIPPDRFNLLDQKAQIEELITGEIFGRPLFEICYERQLPWMREKFVHVSRFEELVGSLGDGDDKLQLQAVKNLASHIGIKISKKEAQNIADDLFGETWSFRQGQIGSYKKHFTKRHKELFKKKYGQVLIDLNYEKGLDW